jgi:hypothetical protein
MAENLSKTTRVPKLRVSDTIKRANDFEHTKSVMNHYINAVTFLDEIINPTTRDVRLFYEAYNNRLPDSYFRYVTNPLNSSNSEYTNWPARLRPYSIIRPNVDLLEGEYERRPFAFAVKVHNADAVNHIQEGIYKDILGALEQQFINSLNEQGQQTGLPSQPYEPPAKIKAAYASNYRDKRAEMGEAALNIIIDQQHLEEKFKRLFRDWLIAGECFTYKGVRGNQLTYERVSPLDLDYDKSPDCEYIEDGSWAVRRMYLTPAEVTDNFYEYLNEDELDLIEDQNGHLAFRAVGTGSQATLRDDRDLRRTKVVVFHVVWKYLTKVGILSYTNPITGELEEIEVPETFKADKEKGEEVTWYWVNEVWEGYRIGAGSGAADKSIYLGIQPVPGQRNTVNNLSECKLPYNGKRFSDTHSQNISIVEMGMSYETLHRILHFQMEKTIAKSKGKIILMDQNAIPKKHGWDEEKFFYWADATGWALIDRNQPGADKNFNQYTVLDLGLYQHIENLISLMTFVKQEWDELLGITRQRKGQVKASDTAGGTQTAVDQSTVISEKVFSRFEEFVRAELQGLLDVSKTAWSDGFQAAYQGDDQRTAILQIDPGEYIEMDMGVYISRSARDLANLEMVRQQVQSFAQNGANPSTIVDVVQARSLSKLKAVLQEAELKSMEAANAAAQSEQDSMERLEMIRGQFEQLKGLVEERLIHVKYDREEDLEMLKQSGEDQNPDPVIDPSGAQKVALDDQNKKREITLKERSEQIKARQKDRELDLKEKDIKQRKEIAELQARTALKNKVAGEKSKAKSKK